MESLKELKDSKKETLIREIELEFQYVSNNELTEEQKDDSYQALMDQLDIVYRRDDLEHDLDLNRFRITLDIIDDINMSYAEALLAAINFLNSGEIPGREEIESFTDSSADSE